MTAPLLGKWNVNPDTGCWEWAMGRWRGGYGQIRREGKNWQAHRWVYHSLIGPLTEGLVLDHLCRVTHCVNPDHLEEVTHAENILRGDGVAATNAQKTHCLRGHEYNEENTRTSGARKNHRQCRTCGRDRMRKIRKALGE